MQQGCWDKLEGKMGQSRAGPWEEHPALSGVIAHYMESFEPENSLKSLLNLILLTLWKAFLFWSNSHSHFNLLQTGC